MESPTGFSRTPPPPPAPESASNRVSPHFTIESLSNVVSPFFL